MITPEIQETPDHIAELTVEDIEEGQKFDVENIEPHEIVVTIVPTPTIDFIHINK